MKEYQVVTMWLFTGWDEASFRDFVEFEDFDEKVAEELNRGWQVAGGVSTTVIPSERGMAAMIVFSQAMIR